MNQVTALLERFIFNIEHFQDDDDYENRGEQRMEQAQMRFLIQKSSGDIRTDHQGQVEYLRMNQRMHTGLFFSFFEFLLNKGYRSDYQNGTDYTRNQDHGPVMRNYADRCHQSDTGGKEEQAHIVRQQFGDFIHMAWLYHLKRQG